MVRDFWNNCWHHVLWKIQSCILLTLHKSSRPNMLPNVQLGTFQIVLGFLVHWTKKSINSLDFRDFSQKLSSLTLYQDNKVYNIDKIIMRNRLAWAIRDKCCVLSKWNYIVLIHTHLYSSVNLRSIVLNLSGKQSSGIKRQSINGQVNLANPFSSVNDPIRRVSERASSASLSDLSTVYSAEMWKSSGRLSPLLF